MVGEGAADTTLPQFFIDSEKDLPAHSSGCEVVAMIKSAEPWHGNNFAIRICILRSDKACRSLLVQAKMSPVLVIVTNLIGHEAFHMALIQYDQTIEQVSAAVADPSLSNTVLPRTSEQTDRTSRTNLSLSVRGMGSILRNIKPCQMHFPSV